MNDFSSFYQTQQIRSNREESFDRHVLGRLVMHAAFESGQAGRTLGSSLGLNSAELNRLLDYLHVSDYPLVMSGSDLAEPEDEEVMLRVLLEHNGQNSANPVQWLPSILARRSMEPNHLWEDLGLAERPDLTKLLLQYFPGLACKNTRNMRWKRFLYRSLCEAEGFTMCPSPTCDSCSEFHICYGDDSGEAVMARNQRVANLAET